MTTIRSLITGSMRLLNVVQANEAPTADDMDIALQSLNALIDSWSNDNLNIYTRNPYYFPLVGGKQSYTLGVGGDFDVARPMGIDRATISYGASVVGSGSTAVVTLNSSTVDIPMESLNDAQWAAIGVKAVTSTFPTKFWDNGGFPLRTVSFWPIPTTNTPVTLWLWQPLIDASNLDAELAFPKGYERALRFNLAVELAPEFGKQCPEQIVVTARQSLGSLKRVNHTTQIMNGSVELADGSSVFNWILGTSTPASNTY